MTDRATGEPEKIVVADEDALALVAAERIVAVLSDALLGRSRAHLALTGGSTPRAVYRRLVEPSRSGRVDWSRVDLWWGDDRFVRRTDPRSNVLAADEVLLGSGGVPVPAAQVHPIPVDLARDEGRDAAWCAGAYGAELRRVVPERDGWPAFDLVLVGIGGDGHLLSVFPGSPALTSDSLALAIPAPTHIAPHVERVTLNPAILGAADRILVMVAGGGKADVVARILEGPRDPTTLPAVLARRASATWLIDAAAAGALTSPADRAD